MKILNENVGYLTKSEVIDFINSTETAPNQKEETMKHYIQEYCADAPPLEVVKEIKEELGRMELTQFEIYQLIEIWPQTLLCLQLVIEEMEERFNENELFSILELFKKRNKTELI
ncbi:hypothetical protein TCON_0164 [Astathelohania contejeani]|uniref:DNA-directed RNA polymerase III subunit RPC9 n=1 Tax=Astathelohania contejeani TaxID=164912 RepID=A0ABQ7I2E2_9MICR|nr:hypothetical protein TCON_0164 [Thelohania contejeani]